jgi:hypothetical protein
MQKIGCKINPAVLTMPDNNYWTQLVKMLVAGSVGKNFKKDE